jgi:methyltransferase (TIGR00027 family)
VRSLLWLQLRTRVLDDALRDFVRGERAQLLILGAGYDARAARLASALARTVVYEVDHPATQARKRALFERAGDAPPNVVYLAWDFESRPLAELPDALEALGHDRARPTITIWEGVTMYLSEQAIDGALAAVRALAAPGSRLAFTYFDRAYVRPTSRRGRLLARLLAGLGEPWRFGWDPAQLAAWLSPRGWRLGWDASDVELARRLLPAGYAALLPGRGHVALATVET